MPMTTRCRHCGRLFPVYAQQLKERRGKVQCPQCGKRFDALHSLIEEVMPGAATQDEGRSVGGRRRPAATAPADLMTFDEPHRRHGSPAPWAIGILLLLTVLAAQVLWWERGTWLADPGMRGLLERVCGRPLCGLPLPRLAGTMEILDPAMAEDPQEPGVLRLNLTLINRAQALQRLPLLQLELYGADGTLAAVRRLTPALYRPDLPDAAIEAGAALNLTLELAAPPTPPTGFRIKLF
jgi:predicted Zn finger-like uncharacterized protein